MKITVIGQGYVGLPLAMAACEAGCKVYGYDTDVEKIKTLNSSQSVIEDIESSKIGEFLHEKRYIPTTDTSVISDSEIILLCVPTPLDERKKPDLNPLITATKTVAKNLKKGSLVIVESTIEPGTCRDVINPLLIKDSNLKNNDFDLAYSPERIDPTNKVWNISNTPKLVAGLTPNAAQRAYLFYSKFIDSVFKCSSLEVAESAKLLENTFRFVNISMINEISIFCHKLGIDVREVIKAAATKPYGFMPFYPSVGAGGHCIPVDPLYLSNRARKIGAPTRFIDLADQINQQMPGYFVGRAEEKLGGLMNKKVLVVGVSYKPNVADVRETPVSALIIGLKAKGAHVSWHDDLVKEWNDEKSVELKAGFDLAIIATPHSYLDQTKLGSTPILDTRGSI